MTNTSVTDEITKIRARLSEIEHERTSLEPTDFASRAELIDEEHDLHARLAELTEIANRDDSSPAAEHASAATDLTRTPQLPR
jgi:hypothetical protein